MSVEEMHEVVAQLTQKNRDEDAKIAAREKKLEESKVKVISRADLRSGNFIMAEIQSGKAIVGEE